VRGLEADVEVALEIDARGQVTGTSLPGPVAGFGFDEAALVAARSARYRPARREGVAVESTTTLRIVFRMSDGRR
jgi:TonB family protein